MYVSVVIDRDGCAGSGSIMMKLNVSDIAECQIWKYIFPYSLFFHFLSCFTWERSLKKKVRSNKTVIPLLLICK